MQYDFVMTQTTETKYAVEPTVGYTREDLRRALNAGEASVHGNFIVSNVGERTILAKVLTKTIGSTQVDWS